MRSTPGRRARALFSNDSSFIEILSIRIPSAPFQLEQLCPLLAHEESRSNTTLTPLPRTANTMNEVFGYPASPQLVFFDEKGKQRVHVEGDAFSLLHQSNQPALT